MSASSLFSLRQLEYAVAVADTLSFRKAAARCRVAQPSLSAQIAQLEHALGVSLFERDRRGVLVTQAGRELLDRARVVLREAEDLLEASKRARDPLAGTLRVGVIPTISPYLLPCITPAIRSELPGLSVVWVEDKTEVLVSKLAAGDLEAALLALEAEIGDVERAVIATDPFVLATAREHRLNQDGEETPAEPRQLRGESVLLLDDGHCFREQALAFCANAKARELEFRATSLSTLAQMVAADPEAATLLPALSVPTEARRAELSIRQFAAPEPHRTIGLVWRPRSPLRPALEKLAATIRGAYPAFEPPSEAGSRAPRARRSSAPKKGSPRSAGTT